MAETKFPFMTPDQWMCLEDDCYILAGLLSGAGSTARRNVVALSHAFAVFRDLLAHRPIEYGGPCELRISSSRRARTLPRGVTTADMAAMEAAVAAAVTPSTGS